MNHPVMKRGVCTMPPCSQPNCHLRSVLPSIQTIHECTCTCTTGPRSSFDAAALAAAVHGGTHAPVLGAALDFNTPASAGGTLGTASGIGNGGQQCVTPGSGYAAGRSTTGQGRPPTVGTPLSSRGAGRIGGSYGSGALPGSTYSTPHAARERTPDRGIGGGLGSLIPHAGGNASSTSARTTRVPQGSTSSSRAGGTDGSTLAGPTASKVLSNQAAQIAAAGSVLDAQGGRLAVLEECVEGHAGQLEEVQISLLVRAFGFLLTISFLRAKVLGTAILS